MKVPRRKSTYPSKPLGLHESGEAELGERSTRVRQDRTAIKLKDEIRYNTNDADRSPRQLSVSTKLMFFFYFSWLLSLSVYRHPLFLQVYHSTTTLSPPFIFQIIIPLHPSTISHFYLVFCLILHKSFTDALRSWSMLVLGHGEGRMTVHFPATDLRMQWSLCFQLRSERTSVCRHVKRKVKNSLRRGKKPSFLP